MVAIAWLVGFEAVIAYAIPALESPVDAALITAMLLMGIGSGYYGLMGRYWQTLAWFAALAWYASSMARYLGAIQFSMFVAPEAFQLLILLLTPLMPLAWMLSIAATQYPFWRSRWDDDD